MSSLGEGGRIFGLAFPGAWFQPVSVGAFLKGFGWPEALSAAAVLGLFALGYLALAILSLPKQER